MTNNTPQISILTPENPLFPQQFRDLHWPPKQVYVSGAIETLQQPMFAIIGSRQPSRLGSFNAAHFSRLLVERGFCVVSGISDGVSAIAHQSAIKTGLPFATLGICPAGLNHIYPKKNAGLAHQIKQNGLLISEYPEDQLATVSQFLYRDRLIAAICVGVLVVEASMHSSSLQIAQAVVDLGKEVFAIPGSIHEPLSKGCHYLIKNGAQMTEDLDDILRALPRSIVHNCKLK